MAFIVVLTTHTAYTDTHTQRQSLGKKKVKRERKLTDAYIRSPKKKNQSAWNDAIDSLYSCMQMS